MSRPRGPSPTDRRGRLVPVAALAVLLSFVGGAPAQAAERSLRAVPLARGVGVPVGDGRTIVAWPVAGRIHARDAARRSYAVRPPAGCRPARFAGAGAGLVLVQCPDRDARFPPPPPRYAVLRPSTGGVKQIVVANPQQDNPTGAVPILSTIGAQWAQGVIRVPPAQESVWVNWRTGRVIEGRIDPFDGAAWLDLDAPPLGRPLCRPYLRTPTQDVALPPTDVFEASPLVERGWVLLDGGYRFGRTPTLGRCGGRPRAVGPGAASAQLGGGWVVWRGLTGGAVHLIRLRDGRRFRVPARADSLTAHTARELFVWTPDRGTEARGRLSLVPLPR